MTVNRSKYPIVAVSDAAAQADVQYLIEALTDPEVRGSAALRLGEMKAREAVPALLSNLRANKDLDRNAAVIALGKIGDPAAVPALLEIAHEDEAAGVRTTAVDALVALGDAHGLEMLANLAIDPRPLLETSTRSFDVPALRSTPNWKATRRWAIKRLREVGDPSALPILEKSLQTAGLRQRLRLRRTVRSLAEVDDRVAVG